MNSFIRSKMSILKPLRFRRCRVPDSVEHRYALLRRVEDTVSIKHDHARNHENLEDLSSRIEPMPGSGWGMAQIDRENAI